MTIVWSWVLLRIQFSEIAAITVSIFYPVYEVENKMCVEFDVLDGLLLKIFSEKSQRNKTGKKKLTVIASSTSRIEDATPSPKAIPTITSKINRPPKTHWMIDKTLNTFPLSAIVVFFWGVELAALLRSGYQAK